MRKVLPILLFVLLAISLMAAEAPTFVVSIVEKGEETGYGVESPDLENEYAYMLQYYSQEQGFDPIFDGVFLKYEIANLKIQRTLLDYYAMRNNMTIDQLKLEQQVNEIVTNVNNDEPTKTQVVAQYGSMENFYQFVLLVYREDMLRQAAIDAITPVDEAAMKTYYEENKETLKSTNEQVQARHILVDTLEEAEAIKADILAGKTTFAEAAATFSKDLSNSQNGGDLGLFKRGDMTAEFEKASFEAPLNVLVGPVKTEFGYHLIIVDTKTSISTYEEFKASEFYETERSKIQSQAIQTWMPNYMIDNRIEFRFNGTMAAINEFSKLYPQASDTGDYTKVLDFLRKYAPADADGRVLLEICYESIIARNAEATGTIMDATTLKEFEQARLENLKMLSLIEDYTLAALSRYYSLNPSDTRMAIRFLGKYIDQALELTLDEEIMLSYATEIKAELEQAFPYLEGISIDPTADIRDRVVAYTYMIRINNILEKTEENKAILAKILEIDPTNTDVLNLVKP